MRPVCVLLLAAIALAAPSGAVAGGTVFGGGVQGAQGFSYFPLWMRVLQQVRATGDDQPMSSPAPALPRIVLTKPAAAPATKPPAGSAPATTATTATATTCSGACARNRWSNFLESIRSLTPRRQLDAVNRWANAKPYVEDWTNWGVPDYWETPAEFIARGGDCEDYAIAKYFSLVRLGFSPAALRIVVVNDRNLQAFHAVLAVRQSGQTWLLDNAVPAVVPMSVAIQYAPVYALNERSWWLYSAPRIIVSSAYVAENGPATSAPAPEVDAPAQERPAPPGKTPPRHRNRQPAIEARKHNMIITIVPRQNGDKSTQI